MLKSLALVITAVFGLTGIVSAQEVDGAVFRLKLDAPLIITPSDGSGMPDPGANAPLEITSLEGMSLRKDVPFSFALAATGGQPKYLWSVDTNSIGAVATGDNLVGTPSTNGTHSVSLTVSDANGASDLAILDFEVTSPRVHFQDSSVNGSVGETISVTPSFTGVFGPGNPAYNLVNAPQGVSIDSETGVISGTLLNSGHYFPKLAVTDSDGSTSPMAGFNLSVQQPDEAQEGHLSSVTGGVLHNISDRKLIAKGTGVSSGQGITLSPGQFVEIAYDRIVYATHIDNRFSTLDRNCWPDGDGYASYSWVLSFSIDKSIWHDVPSAYKDSGSKNCGHGSPFLSLPDKARDFQYIRVKLISARDFDTGRSAPIDVVRVIPYIR